MPETQDWAAPQLSPVTALTNQPITASEAGQNVTLAIGVASRRIVVVAFTVAPDYTAGSLGVLRDWCTLIVSGFTSGIILARCSVSPESPHGSAPILYGQALANAGENLIVTGGTRQGSGSQQLVYDLSYYLQ